MPCTSKTLFNLKALIDADEIWDILSNKLIPLKDDILKLLK